MKAILRNYRQSPRKVRLIADLVRGKNASEALTTLQFVDKRASGPFAKVISSAVANAKDQGKDGGADEGAGRAGGRAAPGGGQGEGGEGARRAASA